ncbi:hypothetical protein BN891_22280 [Bacteroides xylanisolvens SD CC 2a]|nr:hypothetical protein BN891_22280 [Bacteroides xylanisolvens SD CC 2a]
MVVEHPDTFHRVRGFAGRSQGEQQLVLTVESSRSISFCIQSSKLFRVSSSISYVLLPLGLPPPVRSVWLRFSSVSVAASSATVQSASRRSISDRRVAAFAAQHDIADALFAAHTLEGTGTHVQQVRRLAGGEQHVGRLSLPLIGNGTHIDRYLGYLFRQGGEGGTFNRYHFHILSFLLFLCGKIRQ